MMLGKPPTPPHKYCFLIGQTLVMSSHHFMRHTLVMSSLYAFWFWSVYTNFPAVLTKNWLAKYNDCTWRAFEFERAVWTSLGEWKYFIWKANNDDVTRGFLNKYCFLIGQTLVMSSLYETPIGDVITLYFLILKCLHQFSCSSRQKQGSPSTIIHWTL